MVVWAAFHPHDYTTIITFGRQHISFWKLFWDHVDAPPGGSMTSTGLQQIGRLLRDKQSGAFDVRFTSYFICSLLNSTTACVPFTFCIRTAMNCNA